MADPGGRPPDCAADAPLNAPVFASAYHAGGPVAYARDGNPTWTTLEDVLGELEGGTAIAFASGMAATAAVFDQVPVGGAIVVPARRLLRHPGVPGRSPSPVAGRCGRSTSPTPTRRWHACEGAAASVDRVARPTRCSTSPTSPRSPSGRTRGVRVAVDNTLMTPLGQRPLELGADLVVHSATKLLAGHSDVVLGAVSPLRAPTRATRCGNGDHSRARYPDRWRPTSRCAA